MSDPAALPDDLSNGGCVDVRQLEAGVTSLLDAVGRSSTFTLEPLAGGRNNRTYRVRGDGDDLLLKWYFSHGHDDRDRLGAEFDFGSFLWRNGVRQIAQPLAADRQAGLGLYHFLPGRPLAASDVTLAAQQETLGFLQQINQLRAQPDAGLLSPASEACFSPAAHLARIEDRVQRLAAIEVVDDLDREMVGFVRQQLQSARVQFSDSFSEWAATRQLEMQAELAVEDRCLSPSDFGFHNALRHSDGRLCFFDFEYAGWDDPAKLVGDFFCQIERPALKIGFNEFLEGVARLTANSDLLVQRTRRLFPLYQLKWCCIVLNDFLPSGSARRSFSKSQSESRRRHQFEVARRMFEHVGCVPESDC